MNLLKAIGKGLLSFLGVVTGMAPITNEIVKDFYPAVAQNNVWNGVIAIIGSVERFFTAAYPNAQTGPDKARAALPMIQELLLASDTLAGRKLLDEKLFTDGCNDLITATVKIMNSFDAKQATAPAPAAEPAPTTPMVG